MSRELFPERQEVSRSSINIAGATVEVSLGYVFGTWDFEIKKENAFIGLSLSKKDKDSLNRLLSGPEEEVHSGLLQIFRRWRKAEGTEGDTTISKIIVALETGQISDADPGPSFSAY